MAYLVEIPAEAARLAGLWDRQHGQMTALRLGDRALFVPRRDHAVLTVGAIDQVRFHRKNLIS
jgi:hypothetical protein